jgi:cytochrome c peroxidase
MWGGVLSIVGMAALSSFAALSDPLPPDTTYRPLPTMPFSDVKAADEASKAAVMQRQRDLLEARYDLSDKPIPGVMMSGGVKPVQGAVRVILPDGVTWNALAGMTPAEIRERRAWPQGFMPLPHVKQATGGQVFPEVQIDEIQSQERRDLRRFDVDFDLPDRFTPEFPPPIFLTTHPELGDVSRGQLLTIRNFYETMTGVITPVQMEGLRLLLTPFPQEEFNQTEDRKVAEPSLGVACLDCHSNVNTNAAFHLTPDVRPQAERFRLDTTSLRGLFNQQIHGSKRSLRFGGRLYRVRAAHRVFQRRPRERDAQRREPAGSHQPGGDDGANAEHRRFPAGPEARRDEPARPEPRHRPGAGRRTHIHGEGPLRGMPYPAVGVHGQQHA